VHVISRKRLREAAKTYADAAVPLDVWYQIARKATWANLEDVRKTYPAADAVEDFTVFNIKGNTYRLIVKIEYRFQQVYIALPDTRRVQQGSVERTMKAAPAINRQEYGNLLKQTQPTVIQSEEQNEVVINELERLSSQADPTPEQQELIKLLTVLVEEFENRNYGPTQHGDAVDIVVELMHAHGLKQKDLADIFGSEGGVSDVVRRKRNLTMNQIKKLSRRFNVPADLFFR
jgi:mRNA interferase HigB